MATATKKKAGRPALSQTQSSERYSIVWTKDMRKAVKKIARERGVKVVALVREAIQDLIDKES